MATWCRPGPAHPCWALYGELLDRQPERVLPIAALTARPYLEHWDVAMPRAWGPALAHGLAGRPELARREWLTAEGVLPTSDGPPPCGSPRHLAIGPRGAIVAP